MGKTSKSLKLVPYNVIAAATSGDVDAINKILKHYDGYIKVLCTKIFFDDYGNPHYCVDEDMRRILETKLITQILKFKL
jgi:hypothetical protein